MKNLLTTLFLTFISSSVFAQSYWKHIDTSDGLVSNNIKSAVFEDPTSIFLGSPDGVSHYNQGVITNYTANNSGLNSNNILDLKLSNAYLYIHTDSGLTTFDGNNFVNYTVNNGLPSNIIKEIQLASNGVLWIGTTNGVASFDGTQFTHYPNKVAHALGLDKFDRVYIITKQTIVGNETSTNLQVYDGNLWTSYTLNDPSGTLIMDKPTFKLLQDGTLVISAINTPYYSINNFKDLLAFNYNINPSSSPRASTRQLAIDQNGNYWLGINDLNSTTNQQQLFKGPTSNLEAFYFSNEFTKTYTVEFNFNRIILGTNNGFFIGSSDLTQIDISKEISINNIRALISSNEFLFSANGIPKFEFPKGNNTHGIYASQFIVSGKKSNGTNFNTYPFNITNFQNDRFEIGPKGIKNEVTRSFLSKVTKNLINQHIAQYTDSGYVVPTEIEKWPALGDSTLSEPFELAPFIDVNSNGCYDPANGDYPAIKGDEAIYWINRPPETSALNDLEYHYMLYGFNSATDPMINNTLFLEYTIINRSVSVYDSVKIGVHLDTEIGGPLDDYIGCDSLNNIMYGFNSDQNDETSAGLIGYGFNPPAVGLKFLDQTMDSYVSYSGAVGSHNGFPTSPSEMLNYLNGNWKNGAKITYGGNGFNPSSNQFTKLMFTGNPVNNNGWTEANSSIIPNDKSAIAAIPYFSLQPNERKSITMAIGYAFSPQQLNQRHLNAIPAMINSLNHAKTVYDNMQPNNGVVATNYNCPIIKVSIDEAKISAEDFNIYPVPTSGAFTIESDAQIDRIEVIDIRGVRVSEHTPSSQSNLIDINLPSTINNGLYVVRIQLENQQWISKKIMLSK